jgi:hypothetical protein
LGCPPVNDEFDDGFWFTNPLNVMGVATFGDCFFSVGPSREGVGLEVLDFELSDGVVNRE